MTAMLFQARYVMEFLTMWQICGWRITLQVLYYEELTLLFQEY